MCPTTSGVVRSRRGRGTANKSDAIRERLSRPGRESHKQFTTISALAIKLNAVNYFSEFLVACRIGCGIISRGMNHYDYAGSR